MGFEMIGIKGTSVLKKDGIEIQAFIAGVNSGMYQMPFVIEVRTWAKKWWFEKFYYRALRLDIQQLRVLKAEIDKVVEWHENEYSRTINKAKGQ